MRLLCHLVRVPSSVASGTMGHKEGDLEEMDA